MSKPETADINAERKKPGPKPMPGGRRRNVYIDDESWAAAVELGKGNASDGFRLAISMAKINKSAV